MSETPLTTDALPGPELLERRLAVAQSRLAMVSAERLAESLRSARRIREESVADNTRRAYESHLRYFWTWYRAAVDQDTEERYPVAPAMVHVFLTDHLEGMPEAVAEALAASLGARLPHRLATIRSRIAALAAKHVELGFENPCRHPAILELLASAQRRDSRQHRQRDKKAKPLTYDDVVRMLEACRRDTTLAGVRDAAILLVGFGSGGRRRSELARAEVGDLEPIEAEGATGYLLSLHDTKSRKDGSTAVVPVFDAAGEALRTWIDRAGIKEGPLFRSLTRYGTVREGISGRAIADIVKRRAAEAGLDEPGRYASHSLRYAFQSESARRRIPIAFAMACSDHRDVKTAIGYIHAQELLHNPAARLTQGLGASP